MKYRVRAELLVCIAKADSNLGKQLKTANNIGNVGNTDSGRTQSFATPIAGLEAIGATLNNQYLGSYTKLGELSVGGGNTTGPIYASSPVNWHRNVSTCLSEITGEKVDSDWNFRT